MHIVSVINYKGGVGKTTMTANLAGELAWRGKDVLLIDLDPQASLTFSFMKPERWKSEFADSKTIKKWFESLEDGSPLQLDSLIFEPHVGGKLGDKGNLHMIASHLGLINVDLELATQLGGGSLTQTKRNYLKVHKRLHDRLSDLDEDEYDIVLIDCPPNFNIVTKNAIVASDCVLIPAKPDYLSTLGIDYLIRSLNALVSDFNDFTELSEGEASDPISPDILGVVFTMVQEYGGQPIATIRPFMKQTEALGIPVFESYVKENKTLFADAPQYGVPVVLKGASTGSHRQVVEGIEEFVTEFVAELDMDE